MPFCVKCGTCLIEGRRDCPSCENSPISESQTALPPPPPRPVAPPPRSVVDREQIAIASQIATGAAASMQFQTAVQRQCPQCAHHMIVVFRQPRIGWLLVIIGIVVTPIPLLGWVGGPLMIMVGIVLWITSKGKARYQCPNCNYST